ncbi:hypothetical protein B0A52_03299 [Exophiala mesophila]|uniref:protein-ribulosamine 3-kinase n=1 Tax=Exophiala mesophila TaxID=212818 RepID=A0A438NBF5_EXOME|nr:hypothetical protein B0A52_03299 [Exophiala mesophila]
MPSQVDPATILRALSLDAKSATITSHGGSGFASTFRITTPNNTIFVKTSSSPGAAVMFQGEHASLNAIHDAVPSLAPKALGWGEVSPAKGSRGTFFLATEFLELGGGIGRSRAKGSSGGSGLSLAQKLAKLHSSPAPIPQGSDRPQFGFPVTTCCGDTPQDNTFTSSWADFFANHRLLMILERGEKSNGSDPELRAVVQRTVDQVVPKLLSDGHLGGKDGIIPVVVHGDLWSGNKGKGTFLGRDQQGQGDAIEDVVFDPSACYGHNEYDFGIMNMFGGFGSQFWSHYHDIVPKTEPVAEYDDRVSLYESYHHLNHWAIFGGGYRSGAMSILKGLLRKYEDHL